MRMEQYGIPITFLEWRSVGRRSRGRPRERRMEDVEEDLYNERAESLKIHDYVL